MRKRSVHILYESGPDLRPNGSAYIRLLRPFTHPTFSQEWQVTVGGDYAGRPVDIIIVDRLWHRRALLASVRDLLEDARQAGAKVLYTLDDNFLALRSERKDWRPTEEHLQAVRYLLQNAAGVAVTTLSLKEQFASYNANIAVVPNALDERLLAGARVPFEPPFGPRRIVIGYMGTRTHDDDLMMILPALRAVCERHPGKVEIQLVGVAGRTETNEALKGLPVHFTPPRAEEVEYPLFMLWFTSRVHWDIALAPLEDTLFNRCKSDIKFLDYSAIGAAGVYSRVAAYASSVRHRETGWLAENEMGAWETALEELISNDQLRMQLAQNAACYLYGERVLKHCAQSWEKALENLLGIV